MSNCHCGKNAIYNFIGEKKGRFCFNHKEPNMINVKSKHCESDGCIVRPVYNNSGEKKGRFCFKHKEPSMIDVNNKICEIDECRIRANYNISGEKKGRFCINHKELNMIDVIHKYCRSDGCNTRPCYNISGEKKGIFCFKHKESNMIDVTSKQCEMDGCFIQPSYNFLGEKTSRFCTEHKQCNMINIKNKQCEFNECIKQPSYNFPGEKTSRFCTEHKQYNMINNISKQCEIDGCMKQPIYNIIEQTVGKFCITHKNSNMIDIKHKICLINECTSRTNYGFLGEKITHCAKHAQKGMISFPTKKCETPKCKELGCYELNGSRFCDDHKPNGSNNLGIEKCTVCHLDDILVNGKCSTCDPDIIKLRKHAKENRVRDILTVAGFKFVHDKMLEDSTCGEERPDFQIDCGTHFLYVEVDENQHQTYQCVCEQTRMINLVEVRGMPVRFIRYNPDYYEPLPEQMYVTIEKREKKLIEYVKYAMKHSPVENGNLADALYLFYDEYDTTNQSWFTLIKK
jgi:hypothetical protein